MGSCAAPSAKGDDKFITTDYLQQCRLLYLPASHAEDPCKVIMCMAGKLTGDSGGSECNSAEAAFFNIVKKNKHGFLPNHTRDARKAFLNECPDNGEGGSNQSMISQIISKYGKVRL
ncbi:MULTISPECIES: TrbM/KikA/MpfK family conjugal transfer protein [Enterobacteriaceae]|uniref:TrbM/KikA/MpfK family conjugal transfer protein n=1 Tax=Enterobacteriaceae TaxID=543 RepID=UPI0006765BD9|nr:MULTISPECIES: TrbM/KikA/MpfK family conjugal transfer protein [Enterobacteriaceae]